MTRDVKPESPRVTLIRSYDACAGHRLRRCDWSEEKNREVYGRCVADHGHQYRVEVHLAGPMDPETGLLLVASGVDAVVKPFLRENLDHRFLNDDVAYFRQRQPTAEAIACWLFRELSPKFPAGVRLARVRVHETPDLAAECDGG